MPPCSFPACSGEQRVDDAICTEAVLSLRFVVRLKQSSSTRRSLHQSLRTCARECDRAMACSVGLGTGGACNCLRSALMLAMAAGNDGISIPVCFIHGHTRYWRGDV